MLNRFRADKQNCFTVRTHLNINRTNMSDAKEKSRDSFNRQAPTYDTDARGSHPRMLYPFLLAKLEETPYERALDLGCGTGEVMKRILDADSTKILTGLDLSENMIAEAKKKLGNRASLVLGDSEHLPFADGSFDKVYCNDSFHHYPSPENVLVEIFRVLKPGGMFVLADSWLPGPGRALLNLLIHQSTEGDVRIYSEKEIRKMFSGYFSDIQWEQTGRTAYIASGVKK